MVVKHSFSPFGPVLFYFCPWFSVIHRDGMLILYIGEALTCYLFFLVKFLILYKKRLY